MLLLLIIIGGLVAIVAVAAIVAVVVHEMVFCMKGLQGELPVACFAAAASF